MAYAQQDYGMGAEYGYETEEERRRREEEEARQREIESMANAGMGLPEGTPAGAPASRSLGDIAGAYMNRRVDQAQQRVADVGEMFESPQAALDQRLGMTQEDAANTVVRSQQVKTYGDGSQEQIVKTETPPPAPQISAAAVPVAPTQMAAAPQAQAQPIVQPMTVPAQLPAAGPIDPNAPVPEIGRPPTPGAGVQVAGAPGAPMPAVPVAPTTMAAAPAGGQTPAAVAAAPGASVSQIAQAAPVPAPRPQWAVDLEAAGTDQTKLIDIAANRTYPEDVRKDAKEKLRTAMANADAASEAEKTVTAAAQGDPRAQQKLLNSIKPSTIKKEEDGRVTEGSYIRAYLYARLGLSDLAQEEQQKIMGKNKFGQVQVNGRSYEVETDRTGRVITARDNEGNKVDAPILNKIRAEATKFGVQAFGFTGGISTVPSTGEPLQARQNSISGDAEYVHMTGPKKGQVYAGSEIPVQQRVGTQAMVDYNKKLIDFNTNPNIAGATELMKIAVGNDRGDGAEIAKAKTDIANKMGVGGLAQILGGGPGAASAPAAPAAPAPAAPAPAAPVQRPVTQAAPAPAVAAPAPAAAAGGVPVAYTPSAKRTGESENMYQSRVKREEAAFNAEIQRRKEMQLALEKPAAAAAGADAATTVKNQAFADRTYELMKPINEAILKSTGSSIGAGVDTVAAAIGKSTEGSKAISRLNVLSYGILSNIPRFEGPQSDIDVQMYKQAAGDFANRKLPVEDRLAALDALRTILQRYDKAGKNDWNFGSTGSTGQAAGGGTTSSGNKYKRVQ